jgi:hypothetical protein
VVVRSRWREGRGGKGERNVHDGEQDAAYGTIALECEAFLLGGLADYWDAKGMEVPVWAWMNLLAHGTARRIGECVLPPDKPRTWPSKCSISPIWSSR